MLTFPFTWIYNQDKCELSKCASSSLSSSVQVPLEKLDLSWRHIFVLLGIGENRIKIEQKTNVAGFILSPVEKVDVYKFKCFHFRFGGRWWWWWYPCIIKYAKGEFRWKVCILWKVCIWFLLGLGLGPLAMLKVGNRNMVWDDVKSFVGLVGIEWNWSEWSAVFRF